MIATEEQRKMSAVSEFTHSPKAGITAQRRTVASVSDCAIDIKEKKTVERASKYFMGSI
tara:strand:- start:298 stop:474 length:177 start_codon:yes stop_codon:yes gene_type:complete